jgi:L-ascorbate metabolism protein UlaG (beta-lactamase superfamily)
MKLSMKVIKFTFLVTLSLVLTSGCSTWSPPEDAYYHHKDNAINSDISVRFMGVSTFSITDGKSHILIDGFFSRQSTRDYCKNGMESDESKVRTQLKKVNIPHLDALFTSHAHFDHILDAPIVLKSFNTKPLVKGKKSTEFFGTQSSVEYVSKRWEEEFTKDYKNKIPPSFSTLKDNTSYHIGKFQVTAIETPHVEKKFPVNFSEKLFTCFRGDSNLSEGYPNYSFLISLKAEDRDKQKTEVELRQPTILIIPSANISEDDLNEVNADIVFLGIGLLKPKNVEDYWNKTVSKVNASIVVPIHWDDLYKSLDEPLESGPNFFLKTDKVIRELERLAIKSQQTKLTYFRVFEKVKLPKFVKDK